MADYSESDVQSLVQKLREFKQTLTPGEQAALTAVVQRAMPQSEDVEGFVAPNKLPNPTLYDPLGSVFSMFQYPGPVDRNR